MDQQLWYHVVGTPQDADKWVYAVPEHPEWFIGAEVTHDGRRALLPHLLAFFADPPHPLPEDAFQRTKGVCVGCRRYLLISLSAGCEPTNRLFWLDLEALPRSTATKALDLTLYDRRCCP